MSLRKNEAITVFHFRIFRIYVHLLKIEICNYVCDRKRAAGMSASCIVNSLDDVKAHVVGKALKIKLGCLFHYKLLKCGATAVFFH